jgi:6-phosphofructokinase 1
MDTVCKLDKYINEKGLDFQVIGIPKTIDNDLPVTHHSPGFKSAAKYLAVTVNEIARDSMVYNCESVTVVEVMGRDTGWLAASLGAAAPNDFFPVLGVPESPPVHLIYLPEVPFSFEQFISDIKQVQKQHKSVIAAVSEGIRFADGRYVGSSAQSGQTDIFGHSYLSGAGKVLERLIQREIGCKVRSIELNVMQRCSAHLQSVTDIVQSEAAGAYAVECALNGLSGIMVTLGRQFSYTDAANAANKIKYFPAEWINSQGNGITPEALKYF